MAQHMGWIISGVSLLLFIMAGIISWRVAAKVTKLEREKMQGDITKLNDDIAQLNQEVRQSTELIRSWLFMPDGQTVYMSRAACGEQVHGCQARFCSEFDRVHRRLDKMDQQRDDAREATQKELKQINRFMGQMEEHLKKNGHAAK